VNRMALAAVAGALIFAAAFHVSAARAATETVVYSFCSQTHRAGCRDGASPDAGLISVRGILYGTTSRGGDCGGGEGTVFSLDPKQGTLTTLHSFCDPRISKDGSRPEAGVTWANGKLYGTTIGGGNARERTAGGAIRSGVTPRVRGLGTVFSVDPATGSETVLHRFLAHSDGAYPEARVIELSGTLYGTTTQGGTLCSGHGCGTVFSLDPATGAETVVHAFGRKGDGRRPPAGLNHVNGILYGTTPEGGAYGGGTVFSLDPATGAERVVYSFCAVNFPSCTDGQGPAAALLGRNGLLYGTTDAGGASAAGTVFSVDPGTGVETVLYSFCTQSNCADGKYPEAGLIDVNGVLYGTTYFGGNGTYDCETGTSCGTVFSLDPSTAEETVLHSFCSQYGCPDGAYPNAGLVELNGTLYGTTPDYGAHGRGTVFAITLAGPGNGAGRAHASDR